MRKGRGLIGSGRRKGGGGRYEGQQGQCTLQMCMQFPYQSSIMEAEYASKSHLEHPLVIPVSECYQRGSH